MGMIQRKRAILMDYDPLLPSGYRRKKYLEANGTQYILTALTYTYGYEIKIETVNRTFPGATKGLFGWWNASSQNNLQTYNNSPINNSIIFAHGTDNAVYNVGFPFSGVIIADGVNVTANGQTYTTNAIPPDIDVRFALFGYNRTTGVVATSSNIRIYYAKFYDSNRNLIGNYIPCLRKSDNVLGMYDTVTKQFYTNNGTGTFVAG